MKTPKIETHFVDVAIVGAGGSGLMTAFHTSHHAHLKVACISKVHPTQSHTVAAQGGINAALGNVSEDHWQWHCYDTIRGSDWLADADAAERMCRQAMDAITSLEKMGVPFTRQSDGKLYQRVYGGQSSQFGQGKAPARACAAADRTGHSILHTLYQQCVKQRVAFFSTHMALDLIMDDGICCGVVTLNVDRGVIEVFRAHHVVLATGGFGYAYATTTASSICTGDGGAMALRAGLPLKDMEFIQFHPTGLYGSGLLISEAARGEGGYLLNGKRERFMEAYAPHYRDLAPRDVIARAMAIEIMEGRGAGEQKDHVLLCVTHLGEEAIRHKLPTTLETARTFARKDITQDPIPVVPSVHYTMGGIPTDINTQALDANSHIVPGLYAIGEAACTSVHGANRLGCNGLLELVVFGKICAHTIISSEQPTHHKPLKDVAQHSVSRLSTIMGKRSGQTPSLIRKTLGKTLAQYAGVFRNQALLQEGLSTLQSLQHETIACPDASLIYNHTLIEALETQNMLAQGIVTIHAALKRKESRGSHYRQDFLQRDDTNYRKHSLAWFEEDKTLSSTWLDVRLHCTSIEAKHLTPQLRSY